MLKTNRKENVTLGSGKQTNNKKRMLKWNVNSCSVSFYLLNYCFSILSF